MDGACTVLIGDEGGQHLLMRALHRPDPQETDYWDGNWIESQVLVAAGGFHGSIGLSLRAEEFVDFRDQLASLSERLDGTARFSTMEGQLKLTLSGDGKGHVLVEGVVLDEAGVGNSLSFSFEIDQTYLSGLLQSLDAVITRFPVVGRRHGRIDG